MLKETETRPVGKKEQEILDFGAGLTKQLNKVLAEKTDGPGLPHWFDQPIGNGDFSYRIGSIRYPSDKLHASFAALDKGKNPSKEGNYRYAAYTFLSPHQLQAHNGNPELIRDVPFFVVDLYENGHFRLHFNLTPTAAVEIESWDPTIEGSATLLERLDNPVVESVMQAVGLSKDVVFVEKVPEVIESHEFSSSSTFEEIKKELEAMPSEAWWDDAIALFVQTSRYKYLSQLDIEEIAENKEYKNRLGEARGHFAEIAFRVMLRSLNNSLGGIDFDPIPDGTQTPPYRFKRPDDTTYGGLTVDNINSGSVEPFHTEYDIVTEIHDGTSSVVHPVVWEVKTGRDWTHIQNAFRPASIAKKMQPIFTYYEGADMTYIVVTPPRVMPDNSPLLEEFFEQGGIHLQLSSWDVFNLRKIEFFERIQESLR